MVLETAFGVELVIGPGSGLVLWLLDSLALHPPHDQVVVVILINSYLLVVILRCWKIGLVFIYKKN